jgi:rfaE bifunctional protein kinase chain/domain
MKLERVAAPPPAALKRWLARFRGLKVVVWGDFLCDEYWFCRSSRLSREAPVPVLEYETRELRPGGAGNAALNLAALGAAVAVVGWCGRDEAGERLVDALRAQRIDTSGLAAGAGEDTVVKTRIMAGAEHTARQQVVRVDRGARFAPTIQRGRSTLETLARATRGAQAIVLSDYGYDSVLPGLANRLIPRWRARGLTVALDSRFRLAEFRGVTVATPNESEAAGAAGVMVRDEAALSAAAERVRRRTRVEHLIITRGRDGLTLWEPRRALSLEAWGGAEAVDVTGAGDAVVATATLALAAGAPALAAAALANVAGSVAVSRRGAVAVRSTDVARALGASRARA